MATLIRPEISRKNRYWISKHRHYELKHFCLQYPQWKKALYDICDSSISSSFVDISSRSNTPSDPTSNLALTKASYLERIQLVEDIAKKTDKDLSSYVLKAVTEGLSYSYLKSRLNIPCGRDMYYDRYRRFFWLLSNERD